MEHFALVSPKQLWLIFRYDTILAAYDKESDFVMPSGISEVCYIGKGTVLLPLDIMLGERLYFSRFDQIDIEITDNKYVKSRLNYDFSKEQILSLIENGMLEEASDSTVSNIENYILYNFVLAKDIWPIYRSKGMVWTEDKSKRMLYYDDVEIKEYLREDNVVDNYEVGAELDNVIKASSVFMLSDVYENAYAFAILDAGPIYTNKTGEISISNTNHLINRGTLQFWRMC